MSTALSYPGAHQVDRCRVSYRHRFNVMRFSRDRRQAHLGFADEDGHLCHIPVSEDESVSSASNRPEELQQDGGICRFCIDQLWDRMLAIDEYPYGEPWDPEHDDHPDSPVDPSVEPGKPIVYLGVPSTEIYVGERLATGIAGRYIMTMWKEYEEGKFEALEKRSITDAEAVEWVEAHTDITDGYDALDIDRGDEDAR